MNYDAGGSPVGKSGKSAQGVLGGPTRRSTRKPGRTRKRVVTRVNYSICVVEFPRIKQLVSTPGNPEKVYWKWE